LKVNSSLEKPLGQFGSNSHKKSMTPVKGEIKEHFKAESGISPSTRCTIRISHLKYRYDKIRNKEDIKEL